MSTPTQPGKTKIAGIVLLAVAAVALVFGVVSAAGGGDGQTTNAANRTQQQQQHQRGQGGGKQHKPGQGATNKPAPSRSPGTNAQRPGQAPGGQSGGQPTDTKVIQPPNPQQEQQQAEGQNQPADAPAGTDASAPVRVYNNSTVRGLADRAADRLRGDGFKVVSVGNYPNGVIPTTTVYYRPGAGEQSTAEAAAKQIGAKAEPRFPGLRQASPGVIVIVTKDYQD